MGGCVSCTSAQVPEVIEENIFDILPRDPHAPDDLFKPLDVHFARNHSIGHLLSLYPSRRLPAEMVACVWRHYFEGPLASAARSPLAPTPTPPPATLDTAAMRGSLAPTTMGAAAANPWRHSPLGPASAQVPLSPSLSGSSLMPPVLGGGGGGGHSSGYNSGHSNSDDSGASARTHGSFRVAGGSPGGGGSRNGTTRAGSARALAEHSSFGSSSITKPLSRDASQGDGVGCKAGAAASTNTAPVENRSEIESMQHLLTDILRHDLACLKERYDEVLAASLVMPPEEDETRMMARGRSGRRRPADPSVGTQDGPHAEGPVSFASFDPAPVLRALRGDLQRLNNMPIDYLARVALREMKGGSEEDLAAGGGGGGGSAREQGQTSPDGRKSSLSLQRQHSALLNAPHSAAATTGGEVSPLDRPALPSLRSPSSRAWAGSSADAIAAPAPIAGTGLASTRVPLLLPSLSSLALGAGAGAGGRSSAQLSPLSFELFASSVDSTLRNLLDRFYRKGWWILFSLNLVHNARKVYACAGASVASASGGGAGSMGRGSAGACHGGSSGRLLPARLRRDDSGNSWGDRIGAAAAVVALDAERASSAVKLRKSSVSASAQTATPLHPHSRQEPGTGGPQPGSCSPGVGPVSSRAASPSPLHPPPPLPPAAAASPLPALRPYRSSLSRGASAASGVGVGIAAATPLPLSPSVASPSSPAQASFKLPPLLIIRNDNAQVGPGAPLTALSLSPSSSRSSASFAFAAGGLHSPIPSPPQSGTAAGAAAALATVPAGFAGSFPSPCSTKGRSLLRQPQHSVDELAAQASQSQLQSQPPLQLSLAAIQEVV